MSRKRLAAGLLSICALSMSCSGPTSPSSKYAGVWAGTTAQGAEIAFTISSSDKVTSITVGYDFNGCKGSRTFSNLDISIIPNVKCIDGPCPDSLASYRPINFAQGAFLEENSTAVNGFLIEGTAVGSAGFRNYGTCGSATSVGWNATKR